MEDPSPPMAPFGGFTHRSLVSAMFKFLPIVVSLSPPRWVP